jgi:hypothetical protein
VPLNKKEINAKNVNWEPSDDITFQDKKSDTNRINVDIASIIEEEKMIKWENKMPEYKSTQKLLNSIKCQILPIEQHRGIPEMWKYRGLETL